MRISHANQLDAGWKRAALAVPVLGHYIQATTIGKLAQINARLGCPTLNGTDQMMRKWAHIAAWRDGITFGSFTLAFLTVLTLGITGTLIVITNPLLFFASSILGILISTYAAYRTIQNDVSLYKDCLTHEQTKSKSALIMTSAL